MQAIHKLRNGIMVVVLCAASATLFAQGFGDRLDVDPRLAPFYHGVASGDPLPDRVILWTRVTTDEPVVYGIWRMATDSLFTQDLHEGTFSTDATRDYTVKVDAPGLSPNTTYYYEFEALGKRSVRGRTKTTPVGNTGSYRIVFLSCGDMTTGYFNVLSRITERNDFDAIYHLGDYIYEYQSDKYLTSGLKVRDTEPAQEIIELADYRTRYSAYRLDPEMRKMHQQYPFIITWDDHETANDSYKDGSANHTPSTEGTWQDRKTGAAQAFHEWMPIRANDSGSPLEIQRSFDIGDLATFYLPETRLTFRNKQEGIYGLSPELDHSGRGMLDPNQFNWLKSGLQQSQAQWKVLVSPVTFSTLILSRFPDFRNPDLWDGYPYQRRQLLNFLANNNIGNFVTISGDYHMAFAMDIPLNINNVFNLSNYDPATGAGSIGVNFVGTSYSAALCCRNTDTEVWRDRNPHMKYVNVAFKGYNVLDITPEKVTCDYFYVNTTDYPNTEPDWHDASWCVEDGGGHLVPCAGPSVSLADPIALAPCWPRQGGDTLVLGLQQPFAGDIIGLHPVPAVSFTGVQFYLGQASKVRIVLTDMKGRTVLREQAGWLDRGIHYRNISLNTLPAGQYVLTLYAGEGSVVSSRKLIKQ